MNQQKQFKRFFISSFSMLLNTFMLLVVKYIWGFEIAVLVGIATIVGTIDEFGYTEGDK